MVLDSFAIKLVALFVIYLFLPLSALTYYSFRHPRRQAKARRITNVLQVSRLDKLGYNETYPGRHLALAVVYSSIVCLVGLAALMFSGHIEAAVEGSSTGFGDGGIDFPVDDSLLMLGMAFLGAYLWGIQNIFRRYMSDDINPGVFYGLSMRMLLAGALAVIIYNAYEALAGGGGGQTSNASVSGIGKTIWPALAFLLGMFPQRGLSWLREKVAIFSPEKDPTVRDLPLEMIEGIELHDRLRLEEYGLDNCHDLATTDFVPLAIQTPYSARTLIDWMLQAKLCIYCGEAMKDLRNYGIRTIIDVESMDDDEMNMLSQETSVTRLALEHARMHLERSREVDRLRKIGELLGIFARAVVDSEPAKPSQRNVWHATPRQPGEVQGKPRTPAGGEATPRNL